MRRWDNLAKRHAFDEEPRKLGLLVFPASDDPAVVIAAILEVTDETIVVGSRFDDLFTTTFDRFTGLGADDGKLKKFFIPASELDRVAAFEAKGAYAAKAQPVTPPDASFDPDAAM
jgi:hypothetical protein